MAGEPLEVGQLRSQTLLGTEAVYRIRAIEDTHVLVEAVDVPMLARGYTFRITPEAARSMHLAEPSE